MMDTEQQPNPIPPDFIAFEKNVMKRRLSKFHIEDIGLLWGNRFVYYIWPRGHLKTTIFSIDYAIYNLWKMQNYKICLISSALDQSWKIMEEVQYQIESNEKLKWLVPGKFESNWNKSQTTTTNGNSYIVKPLNDTIRGTHVDLLIADDLLRNEDITQDEVKERFWSLAFPTVMTRKGKIILVGTPMTTDDLFVDMVNLQYAQQNDEMFEIRNACEQAGLLPIGNKRQAVIIADDGKWIDPLWYERFTLNELKAIKALQGSLIFDREYLCNPRAGNSAIFTEEMLQKRHRVELSVPREDCIYYLGIDVAISEQQTADYSVFLVLEQDKTGSLKEVKIERYQGKPTSWQLDRIRELHQTFIFKKILVEDRGLSQGMARDMQIDNILCNVTELFPTNKPKKELLVSRIECALSSGQLVLLDNSIHLNELKNFGIKKDRMGRQTYEALGRHDDTVIGLGLALEAALNKPAGTSSITFIGETDEIPRGNMDCPTCGGLLIKKEFNKQICEDCKTEFTGVL